MCPTKNSFYRILPVENVDKYRTEYRRDYGRVLHSPSFRRLEHKTQLFPGHESDFFRNRLTHSLEVAQIAKTIALKMQEENPGLDIEPDVCEIAGLLHDLGHPPFGHNGEKALDSCMIHYGGFEGNAQTLRIITRLEKKETPPEGNFSNGRDCRVGLNLTARVIASVLKYDQMIPVSRDNSHLVKGYYHTEKDLIETIKAKLLCPPGRKLKTIECSIMDLADDIAYSTYDIEDAFKAGFLTPFEMMSSDDALLLQIIEKLKKDEIDITVAQCRSFLYGLFIDTWKDYIEEQKKLSNTDDYYNEKALGAYLSAYDLSKKIASDGYKRTEFSSSLVGEFIKGISIDLDKDNNVLSNVNFNDDTKKIVNILKHFSYVSLISSSRLKVVENRGQEIIKKLFDRLASKDGYIYLPEDFQEQYKSVKEDTDKKRIICDFIAGMTDRYALEFYGRLYSENPQTIFKPL